MFDASKKNQANQAGNLSGIQSLSADQRNKLNAAGIQSIPADQRAIVAAVAAAAPAGLPSTLNTGLVAYWNLNETSGSRLDSFGTNHLTDNNTVGSVAGVQGNAATFLSANNEFLSIADNPTIAFGNINWTMSFWVNVTSKTQDINIIAKYDTGGLGHIEFDWFYYRTGNVFTFEWYNLSTVIATHDFAATTFPNGTWVFVVVDHDATNHNFHVSFNGGSVTTIAESATPITTTAPLQFGNYLGSGGSAVGLDGSLDLIGYWHRLLTAGEITTLYNSGSGQPYL